VRGDFVAVRAVTVVVTFVIATARLLPIVFIAAGVAVLPGGVAVNSGAVRAQVVVVAFSVKP
jgi:hypothetical protein